MKYIEITQQLEYYSIEKLKMHLKENDNTIKRYAYIIHDKEDEKIHFHCMIEFYSKGWTFEQIEKKFDIKKNYLEKPKSVKNTYFHMCRYLIHINAPEKYQYNINDVKSNFDYMTYINSNSYLNNDDFVSDLVDYTLNIISLREMCVKYGRDFIKNYEKYRNMGLMLTKTVIEDEEIL